MADLSPTLRRVSKIRKRMLLDNPWFGTLALRLALKEETVGTACTDGTDMIFDPAFVESLGDNELSGLIAHEVMHCALGHMFRIGNREMKLWNAATDQVINRLLIKSHFSLPAWDSDPRVQEDMSAEQVYAILEKDKREGGDEGGKGKGKKKGFGEFSKPQAGDPDPNGQPQPGAGQNDPNGKPQNGQQPSPTPGQNKKMTKEDWQVASEQASMVCRRAGTMPGGLERVIKASREGSIDWKSYIQQWVAQNFVVDHTWSRPDRRFIALGMYLPGVEREGSPRIGMGWDVSGSVGGSEQMAYADEVSKILREVKPEEIEVAFCDTQVRRVAKFTPDDDMPSFNSPGGGGTALKPVFEHFKEEPPTCLIYLTDLDSYDIHELEDPGYPVLFVTPATVRTVGPFGQTIRIDLTQE